MAAVDETICRMISAGRFISRGKGRHITRVIDSYELILVVSGVLEMFEESRRFRVAAGEYLVLSPGRRHGGIGAYSADLSFFWCHFLARSEAGKARLAALAGSAPAAGRKGRWRTSPPAPHPGWNTPQRCCNRQPGSLWSNRSGESSVCPRR